MKNCSFSVRRLNGEFYALLKWFSMDKLPFAVIFGRSVAMINSEGVISTEEDENTRLEEGFFGLRS